MYFEVIDMSGIRKAEMNQVDEKSIVINAPKEGEFYILGYDYTEVGRGHGVEFENKRELVSPPDKFPMSAGAGFPPFKQAPRLRYNKREGDMPRDLQSGVAYAYWLVSEPLKKVFESVDPEGFAFVLCDFILDDSSKGPLHYLCDVVRTLDAVDEVASKVRIEVDDDFPNGKYYSMGGGARLAFKKSVVGSAHVFRTPYNSQLVICDRFLRDALVENGFGGEQNTRGVSLEDAAANGIYALPSKYWPENK